MASNLEETLPDPFGAPQYPHLIRTEQLLSTLFESKYWQQLCPDLNCTVNNNTQNILSEIRGKKTIDTNSKNSFRTELCQHGFFQFSVEDISLSKIYRERLAKAICILMQHKWAPTFIFMFDETWAIIESMREELEYISGNCFVGDVYAWYVDPCKLQKGWGPHRDRMGSGPDSFRGPDKIPKLSTTWLALTEASPKNSCLYVIPADIDPFYHELDKVEVNPLLEALSSPDNFQHIKSLPCAAGAANHFSHKLIHWGSYAGSTAKNIIPRIAMSWVIADTTFEEPCFKNRMSEHFPSIEERLGLICGQMVNYSGQTGIKTEFRDLCFRIFKRVQDLFCENYRDKVMYIYYLRPPPKNLSLSTKNKKFESPIDKERNKSKEFISSPIKDETSLQGIKEMFLVEDSD